MCKNLVYIDGEKFDRADYPSMKDNDLEWMLFIQFKKDFSITNVGGSMNYEAYDKKRRAIIKKYNANKKITKKTSPKKPVMIETAIVEVVATPAPVNDDEMTCTKCNKDFIHCCLSQIKRRCEGKTVREFSKTLPDHLKVCEECAISENRRKECY